MSMAFAAALVGGVALQLGDDIAALSPVLDGPAIQILPLALCV